MKLKVNALPFTPDQRYQKETADCVSIAFEIPKELKHAYQFKQGQNLTFKVNIDGEETRRSYSICSSPLDNELRVAIKKLNFGKFSNYANTKLRKGDWLEVLPPSGRFYTELKAEYAKNYLAMAAGSGITPILSIIKTTLATEPKSHFTLVYGNRNRASIIFREQLEALKNRYMDRLIVHHILSREKTDAPINHGRIDEKKCEQLTSLIDFKSMNEIFLCGPQEMIFSISEWLQRQGIEKKKIHFELFTIPGEKQEVGPRSLVKEHENTGLVSKVTVKLDGIAFDFDLQFDGDAILDAALKQGADLPYACKGGVCSTCRAKLVEGKVELDHNYALEPEEIEAGYILTCQSHPRTEKVVVDFDAK